VNHPLLLNVGRRVAELRIARKLTQEELAERAEVSARYIQRIERGRENLTLVTVANLAKALGVEVVSLLRKAKVGPAKPGRPKGRKRAAAGNRPGKKRSTT
jgi:transcriptional regulator with XRE-family HTH domain